MASADTHLSPTSHDCGNSAHFERRFLAFIGRRTTEILTADAASPDNWPASMTALSLRTSLSALMAIFLGIASYLTVHMWLVRSTESVSEKPLLIKEAADELRKLSSEERLRLT